MADCAYPVCSLGVVFPASLADSGLAHLAEGAAVDDATKLGSGMENHRFKHITQFTNTQKN